MRLVFDPEFDSGCWPGSLGEAEASAGEAWVGAGGMLRLLETALGLGGPEAPDSFRVADLIAAFGLSPTDGMSRMICENPPITHAAPRVGSIPDSRFDVSNRTKLLGG